MAAIFASAMSSTKIKSLNCIPEPKIIGDFFSFNLLINFVITPA